MFALASTTLDNSLSARYMDAARRLTHTCHEAYARSDTGLGPEAFRCSTARHLYTYSAILALMALDIGAVQCPNIV
jgi:hypothetical protein